MMCNRLATLLSIVREQDYGINIAWLQCCHTRQVHTHHKGKLYTSILLNKPLLKPGFPPPCHQIILITCACISYIVMSRFLDCILVLTKESNCSSQLEFCARFYYQRNPIPIMKILKLKCQSKCKGTSILSRDIWQCF